MVKAAIIRMGAERAIEQAAFETAETLVNRTIYNTPTNVAAKLAAKAAQERLTIIIAQEALAISQSARLRMNLIAFSECTVALSCRVVTTVVGGFAAWLQIGGAADAAEIRPIIETTVEQCLESQDWYFKNKRWAEGLKEKRDKLWFECGTYYSTDPELRPSPSPSQAYCREKLEQLDRAYEDTVREMSQAEDDFYYCVSTLNPIIWEEDRGNGTVCRGTKKKVGKQYEDIEIKCHVDKGTRYLTDSCDVVPPIKPSLQRWKIRRGDD